MTANRSGFCPRTAQRAFSLVELSIVLVILGLLTGGILTGQNLIRAAELRSVTTEFQRYNAAVMTFRDKYFALPGDMTNATDFWGAMANCDAASPSGTGKQTCNGNGNGIIGLPAAAVQTGEVFMFWQHLANAGLIDGSYTGIAGSGGPGHTISDENAPSGRLSSSAWFSSHHVVAVPHFNRDLGNVLYIGGQLPNVSPYGQIFLPEEVWNIDKKLDDSKPGTGNVTPMEYANCTNAANANDFSADYDLSKTSASCFITFVGGW